MAWMAGSNPAQIGVLDARIADHACAMLQQYVTWSTSIPWPTIPQPQCAQRGASSTAAHSMLERGASPADPRYGKCPAVDVAAHVVDGRRR